MTNKVLEVYLQEQSLETKLRFRDVCNFVDEWVNYVFLLRVTSELVRFVTESDEEDLHVLEDLQVFFENVFEGKVIMAIREDPCKE